MPICLAMFGMCEKKTNFFLFCGRIYFSIPEQQTFTLGPVWSNRAISIKKTNNNTVPHTHTQHQFIFQWGNVRLGVKKKKIWNKKKRKTSE